MEQSGNITKLMANNSIQRTLTRCAGGAADFGRYVSQGGAQMRALVKIALTAIALLVMSACSNPSIVRVESGQIASAHIKTVYVPRFEGSPEFVEESTDMFVSALEARTSVNVVQGGSLRPEGPDIGAGGNIADRGDAIAVAKRAGAQAVILGKVTSHKDGATLNGFATVRIIDVQSGNVLASFHRPSGMLFAYSEHQAVLGAVKRVAEDAAKALK